MPKKNSDASADEYVPTTHPVCPVCGKSLAKTPSGRFYACSGNRLHGKLVQAATVEESQSKHRLPEEYFKRRKDASD